MDIITRWAKEQKEIYGNDYKEPEEIKITVIFTKENGKIYKGNKNKADFISKLKLLKGYESTIELIEVFGAVEITLQLEYLEKAYLELRNQTKAA